MKALPRYLAVLALVVCGCGDAPNKMGQRAGDGQLESHGVTNDEVKQSNNGSVLMLNAHPESLENALKSGN